MGPIHPLHREAHCTAVLAGSNINSLEVTKQRWPGVPGRLLRQLSYVVAFYGRQRNGCNVCEVQLLRENVIVVNNVPIHAFVVVHAVHLVHRQNNVANAQQ